MLTRRLNTLVRGTLCRVHLGSGMPGIWDCGAAARESSCGCAHFQCDLLGFQGLHSAGVGWTVEASAEKAVASFLIFSAFSFEKSLK